VWGPMLRRAMRWYIAANKSEAGTEGSIVLAQTAHELLSWTRFVTVGKLSSDFEKMHAEDKLRLMLGLLSVPLEVPASLRVLAAKTKGKNMDGPMAIVELRNSIVHPKKKRLGVDEVGEEGVSEAYRLSLWYLDLTLLYLFGYEGKYSSRLSRPQVYGHLQDLPWAI
jgi:hypothetical protein